MENVQLHSSNYIELAELIEISDIDSIRFTPAEAKSLFDLDEPASVLKNFKWNIDAGIIEGTIDGQTTYYPPRLLIEPQVDELEFHPKASDAAIVRYICSKLTAVEFLNKLQEILYQKFDYLSQGQAKTVIKRFVGSALTSSERNDITKIKKKIESCKMMIRSFEGMLNKRSLDRKIRDWEEYQIRYKREETMVDRVSEVENQLKFICYECKTYVEFPETDQPLTAPEHHDKPMALTWGSPVPAETSTKTFAELEDRIQNTSMQQIEEDKVRKYKSDDKPELHLYCKECEQFFELPDEIQKQLDRGRDVTLPTHHDQEMEIRIGEQIKDSEKMVRLREIGKALVDDFESTAFYLCEVCKVIVEFDDTEDYTPQHHDQDMARVKFDR